MCYFMQKQKIMGLDLQYVTWGTSYFSARIFSVLLKLSRDTEHLVVTVAPVKRQKKSVYIRISPGLSCKIQGLVRVLFFSVFYFFPIAVGNNSITLLKVSKE